MTALIGCAHDRNLPKKDPEGFEMRIIEPTYDREKVSFLFVVSPKTTTASVDDRVVENIHLTLTEVRDCQTGAEVKHWFDDFFMFEGPENHIVDLTPGYWYGSSIVFNMFKGPTGPECLDLVALYRAVAEKDSISGQTIKFRVSASQKDERPTTRP